jgi:hypothetical protein
MMSRPGEEERNAAKGAAGHRRGQAQASIRRRMIRIMSMARPLTSFRDRVYGISSRFVQMKACERFGDGLLRERACRRPARRTR